MNEIIGDHNVDKQMTDSRGDVSFVLFFHADEITKYIQVAYLMADISDVDSANIKDLYERLESLPCEIPFSYWLHMSILIPSSPNHDPHSVLDEQRLTCCNQLYLLEPKRFSFDEITRPSQRGLSKRLYMQRSSRRHNKLVLAWLLELGIVMT